MLPVDQVIPFVRNSDPLVQDLALSCLQWVRWPERLTGDFVLDAVEAGHGRLRSRLSDFTPSARVLDYAIESLKGESDDSEMFWPHGVIARAPDSLFTGQVIESVRRLNIDVSWVGRQTQARLDLLTQPTETIRTRLLQACAEADEQGLAMSEQHEIAALVDRLVYRGDSVEWANSHLREVLGSNGWAEIWLFSLLTKARDRSVLNIGFDRFTTVHPADNESLANELSFLIRELCTADELPRVASLWEEVDEGHRSYLIDSVGKLRIPEAEPLLLRLAKESQDATLKTFGAVGLCEMLCTGEDSREFIRDLVDNELFDIAHVDLEELAIPLGIIAGRPFPEEARWRERIANPAERNAARRNLFKIHYGGEEDLQEMIERLRLAAQMKKPVRYEDVAPPDPGAIEPLSKARTVGRNDPCPCGSGKKYKKCCLGRES
jgi:hypothetical protein